MNDNAPDLCDDGPPGATPLALDGRTALPPGKIASVVTYLELRARPTPMREEPNAGLALRRVARPDPAWYRALFRRIGEDWLWFSRLRLDDDALAAILHHPRVEVFALRHRGRDEGLLELDFRRLPDADLAFLGVAPALVGTGAGRYLMNRANELVWDRGPRRFTVNTCTLDHPAALGFYLKAGFKATKRAVEITDDPRLDGVIRRSAAPGAPIIES